MEASKASQSRLQEEDQHVRAHAVEIFLRVTGDEALKWYVAPSTDDEVKMHRSLLDLGDRMIPDLVANARDSYPGGEKACLDLLAFWLGWARQMHCETHVLNPSRLLIEALSDWVLRAERRGDATKRVWRSDCSTTSRGATLVVARAGSAVRSCARLPMMM